MSSMAMDGAIPRLQPAPRTRLRKGQKQTGLVDLRSYFRQMCIQESQPVEKGKSQITVSSPSILIDEEQSVTEVAIFKRNQSSDALLSPSNLSPSSYSPVPISPSQQKEDYRRTSFESQMSDIDQGYSSSRAGSLSSLCFVGLRATSCSSFRSIPSLASTGSLQSMMEEKGTQTETKSRGGRISDQSLPDCCSQDSNSRRVSAEVRKWKPRNTTMSDNTTQTDEDRIADGDEHTTASAGESEISNDIFQCGQSLLENTCTTSDAATSMHTSLHSLQEEPDSTNADTTEFDSPYRQSSSPCLLRRGSYDPPPPKSMLFAAAKRKFSTPFASFWRKATPSSKNRKISESVMRRKNSQRSPPSTQVPRVKKQSRILIVHESPKNHKMRPTKSDTLVSRVFDADDTNAPTRMLKISISKMRLSTRRCQKKAQSVDHLDNVEDIKDMEEQLKQSVQDNLPDFIKLTNWKFIVPHLTSKRLLDDDSIEYLLSESRMRQDKGVYFYLIVLPYKGHDAYSRLYQCLQDEKEHLGHECLFSSLDQELIKPSEDF